MTAPETCDPRTEDRQRRFLLTVRRALLLIVAWIDAEYHLGKQDRG